MLGKTVRIRDYHPEHAPEPGTLEVRHIPLAAPCQPGRTNPANARYVLELLDTACDGITRGTFAALVTAPLHKGVINDALGQFFSGHTEYLAQKSGTERVVMMLAGGGLRVALATTHLPLKDVPAAITRASLCETARILHRELRRRFALAAPRILVAGLNPHAGEGGHLGHEENDTIIPALGRGVNITLGLPFVRTSVDHGTALALAGTGQADGGSLIEAVKTAVEMAQAV